MNKNLRSVLVVLLFGSLACKPVFAIGWNELLFLFLVIVVLLGPPLYRLIRRIERFRKSEKKNNS